MWLSEYAVHSARSSPRLGELAHAFRLVLRVQRAHRVPRVLAVADLADRAERAVEAELVGDRLDDLLQRGGDDVHRLAALAVLLDEWSGSA